jgi:GH18 family chitinase
VAGHEDDFVALVRSIRAELDAISPGYQLTFDTMGRIGNYPVDALTAPGAADAVFVMGYDYRTSGSPVAGSIAPLTGPVYDLTETVLAYLDEVPASRIILGVPWYGRAWSTVSDELNAKTQSGPKFGHSAAVPYAQALEAAAARDVRWDEREATSWFAYQRSNCTQAYGCVTSWRQVYFDDDRALRLKYDLVNKYGIRGVGIWALGYDGRGSRERPGRQALRDTTPPEAGIVAFPADARRGLRRRSSARRPQRRRRLTSRPRHVVRPCSAARRCRRQAAQTARYVPRPGDGANSAPGRS